MKIVMLVILLCLLSCKSVEFDPRTSVFKYILKESHEKKQTED